MSFASTAVDALVEARKLNLLAGFGDERSDIAVAGTLGALREIALHNAETALFFKAGTAERAFYEEIDQTLSDTYHDLKKFYAMELLT